MNGKPDDHPITDIVHHGIAGPGEPLDSKIRQLGGLMSYSGLCHWFEQHGSKSTRQLEPIVVAKLDQMRRAARKRDWETP